MSAASGRQRDAAGWEPTIQLREGLQKTIDYFNNQT